MHCASSIANRQCHSRWRDAAHWELDLSMTVNARARAHTQTRAEILAAKKGRYYDRQTGLTVV